MKYPLMFFCNTFIPKEAAGCARGPVILIRPEYAQDDGIIAHELVHVRQWFVTLGLHSFLYMLFDWYRLITEVEAYRVQAECYPDDRRKLFGEFISKYYNLDITPAEAENLLRR